METIRKKSIDLIYLKQFSNGNDEFIGQMISIFISETTEAILKLEKYLISEDWKALRGIAHKMKPSFTFMGIKELEDVIISIEDSSNNENNLDQLPELIDKVKRVCAKAIKELEEEI